MGCGVLLTLSSFSRFHVVPIYQSIEPTPRVVSGAPLPQLSYVRMPLLACPCQTIGALGLTSRTIVRVSSICVIISPWGFNDYLALLEALEGCSLTARQSAGPYHAASVDQAK